MILSSLALAAAITAQAALPDSAALELQNRKIIIFRAPIGASGPAERVAAATFRIRQAVDARATEVTTRSVPGEVLVLVGDKPVFAVTPGDVDTAAGVSMDDRALAAAGQLRIAITEAAESRNLRTLSRGLLLSLIATGGFALFIFGLVRARRWLLRLVEDGASHVTPLLRIRDLTLLRVEHVARTGRFILTTAVWVGGLGACYGYLTFVLTRFPWTRPWGEALGHYLVATVRRLGAGALHYIPDLVTVALIFAAARLVVRFSQTLFRATEEGRIALPWVHPETASPTRRIVTALLWLFALIIAYPYLPGSHSAAFKGISVFAGLLITLGSTGLVGQAMSGLVLMYSRSFKVGDFIRVNDTMGTVVSLGMLSTRVRTTKNEYVALPNSVIVSGSITNYSFAGQEGAALVLYTSITIGYDVPWRTVHELLTDAAKRTDGVLPAPTPWVLQQALNDWTVEYQVNVSIDPASAERIPQVYSQLRAAIQDAFCAAGVEIMSPGYLSVRDGNTPALPERQRPQGRTPSFRVDVDPK